MVIFHSPEPSVEELFASLSVGSGQLNILQLSLEAVVKSWRTRVPEYFSFTVKPHQDITYRLSFTASPETYVSLEKFSRVCEILMSKVIVFNVPRHYD